VSLLMIPFVIGSLWSLGLALIWQLMCLGMKAGIVLFVVCSFVMTVFRFKHNFNWKGFAKGRGGYGTVDVEGEAGSKPNCTLLDVVLSVFFQTGLSVPTAVWETGIELLLRIKDKKAKLEKKKLMLKEFDSSMTDAFRSCLLGTAEPDANAQYQYGNAFLNKTYSTSYIDEPSEIEECEDLTDDGLYDEPLSRPRRRIRAPLVTPKGKGPTGKPKLTRGRKNKA